MTEPNQLLIFVIKDGVGKSRIESMYLVSGSIVKTVTLNPVKSEALLTNAIFPFQIPHIILLIK